MEGGDEQEAVHSPTRDPELDAALASLGIVEDDDYGDPVAEVTTLAAAADEEPEEAG